MESRKRGKIKACILALLAPVAGAIHFLVYAVPYAMAGKVVSGSTAELALMILPGAIAAALVLMTAHRVNPVAFACLGAVSIYVCGFIYLLIVSMFSALNSGILAAVENSILFIVPTVVVYVVLVLGYFGLSAAVNSLSGCARRQK